MIIIDICLSDIPKDRITTSEKNGKKYCKMVVDARKEKDKFDNTHTLYMNQTKEERADKKEKVYVGSGKELVFNKPVEKQPDYEQLPDDLPF